MTDNHTREVHVGKYSSCHLQEPSSGEGFSSTYQINNLGEKSYFSLWSRVHTQYVCVIPTFRCRHWYGGVTVLLLPGKVIWKKCCGSGMFIPDPGSRIPDFGSWFLPILDPGSRIPNPKAAAKERGEKKIVVIPFFVGINFTKFNIILFLKCWRTNLGQFFKEL